MKNADWKQDKRTKRHTLICMSMPQKKKEKYEENKAVLLQNRGKEKAGIAAILLQKKRQPKKNIYI